MRTEVCEVVFCIINNFIIMSSQQIKELLLIDEGNNKFYTLNVSPEQFVKATIDSDYSAILLVEYLKAGRPVKMDDFHPPENLVAESWNDENMPVNLQNDQLSDFKNSEPVVVPQDEPLDVSCNKTTLAGQPTGQNSVAYNWQKDETDLLISCYKKEGVHLLLRKRDVSVALERFVTNFNRILLEKKGKTIPYVKCCSKIDSLKRLYREHLDLKNKSGGRPCTWSYFEAMHDIFFKEKWVKPLSVAGSGTPANLDVQVAEPRSKKAKLLPSILEEIAIDRRLKQESDNIKHKEKMSRLDRFNDSMHSISQSMADIAAAKKAKLERGDC